MQSQQEQQLYTHAAEPKPVKQRPKYRDATEELSITGTVSNIMFDKRVVRGNTYAARILPADIGLGATTSTMKSSGGGTRVSRAPPRTPEPVEGRKHTDIQTDAYLEELTDTVPEADNGTQTDTFLDRPPTPLFVPVKAGLDATTQIADGDLFDFDFEVEPILEVLVGKVLEQGLMEVLEEEELAAMRAHQEHFEQIRNAELVATQRMEAAESRKGEEKDRRLAQERERVQRERVVREKVAATHFSRGYLSGIVSSVFDSLVEQGVFYDPVLHEVENSFMPWLKEQAANYLTQGVTARGVVRRLIQSAAEKVNDQRAGAVCALRMERAAMLAWKSKQSQVAHALADMETGRQNALGSFLLNELQPRLVPEETVSEVRAELEAAASAKVEAEFEAEKLKASEDAKAAAEATIAENAAKLEELRAAATEEAGEDGLAEDWAPAQGEVPEAVDVDAEVAAAVESVVAPEPKEVTLDDILSALLDKGVLTKDGIMRAMAIDEMGQTAWFRLHGEGEEEEAPPPTPSSKKRS
ncbi:hypothetical protein FOA52_008918 [Chlamydomonas sp. UWO 241]|nr:hypothetical protein FOA52_008918 [Chlamydomonas sp. UWO 241]